MLPINRVVPFKHPLGYFQEKPRREAAGLREKLEREQDTLDDMIAELDLVE